MKLLPTFCIFRIVRRKNKASPERQQYWTYTKKREKMGNLLSIQSSSAHDDGMQTFIQHTKSHSSFPRKSNRRTLRHPPHPPPNPLQPRLTPSFPPKSSPKSIVPSTPTVTALPFISVSTAIFHTTSTASTNFPIRNPCFSSIGTRL